MNSHPRKMHIHKRLPSILESQLSREVIRVESDYKIETKCMTQGLDHFLRNMLIIPKDES